MKRKLPLPILLLLLLSCAPSSAQWERSIGPSGTAVSLRYADSRVLFAAYKSGYMHSSDGGAHWQWSDIIVDGDTFVMIDGRYFFRYNGQIYSSTDLGNSWKAVSNELVGGAFDLAATGSGSLLEVRDEKVARSTDYGSTWQVHSLDGVHLKGITGHLGSSILGVAYVDTAASLMWVVSSDDGETWQPRFPLRNWQSVLSSTIDDVGTIYAAVVTQGTPGYELHVISDSIRQWRVARTDTLHSVIALGAMGHTVYMEYKDRNDSDGVFYSSDGGMNWGSAEFSFMDSGLGQVTGIGSVGDSLLVSTSFEGVYLSTDSGATWKLISSDMGGLSFYAYLETEHGLLGATDRGLFVSTDGGLHWQLRFGFTEGSTPYGALARFKGVIYAVLPVGVCRSLDDGLTWELFDEGVTIVNGVKFVATESSLWLASQRRIYGLSADGTSWVPLYPPENFNYALALAVDGTRLVAGTSSGFLESFDAEMWGTIDKTSSGHYSSSVFVGDGVIYGSDESLSSRSTDGGNTWMKMQNGLVKGRIQSLTIVPHTIIVGMRDYYGAGGAYYSTDQGETWKSLDDGSGLKAVAVNTLYVHDGYLLAGTNGSGTWRRRLDQITSVEDRPSAPRSGLTVWAYPNPTRDRTTIGVSLDEASDVRVTVYDALGRQVVGPVERRLDAGVHGVEVPVARLGSGLYVYRVEAAGEMRSGRLNIVR